MGQKFDLIFLLDQTLLHGLAIPAEHRLGAPWASSTDFRGDLRLKRSSVRASHNALSIKVEAAEGGHKSLAKLPLSPAFPSFAFIR
jgi:hypothetical protein